MLCIQQNRSSNTARYFKVAELSEAIQTMIKLFIELKFSVEAKSQVVFDLEEALQYFDKIYDLRFMEEDKEAIQQQSEEQVFPKAKLAYMKIYQKKMLLDELVDFYNSNPEDEDSQ